MRGMELPVNVLVIVAVAVIVLLGIITLFMGGFGNFASIFTSSDAWNTACAPILTSCTNNHGTDSLSVSYAGKTVTSFGMLCGEMGRFDRAKVTYSTAAGFALAPGITTGTPGDTAFNGCNKACGCP